MRQETSSANDATRLSLRVPPSRSTRECMTAKDRISAQKRAVENHLPKCPIWSDTRRSMKEKNSSIARTARRNLHQRATWNNISKYMILRGASINARSKGAKICIFTSRPSRNIYKRLIQIYLKLILRWSNPSLQPLLNWRRPKRKKVWRKSKFFKNQANLRNLSSQRRLNSHYQQS